jgi:hypothetical protein
LMAVGRRMEPQTGAAETRRREQAVREAREPLLPSSSAPVDGVCRSWAALLCALGSRLSAVRTALRLWFNHVKGIRAPLTAPLCVGVNGIARATMNLIITRSILAGRI